MSRRLTSKSDKRRLEEYLAIEGYVLMPDEPSLVVDLLPHRPKKGDCPLCGRKGVALTRDHIIPKWAMCSLRHNFKIKRYKHLGDGNIQYVCSKCNGTKSGYPDCRHPLAKEFWTYVRDILNKEISKYEEEPRKDT